MDHSTVAFLFAHLIPGKLIYQKMDAQSITKFDKLSHCGLLPS